MQLDAYLLVTVVEGVHNAFRGTPQLDRISCDALDNVPVGRLICIFYPIGLPALICVQVAFLATRLALKFFGLLHGAPFFVGGTSVVKPDFVAEEVVLDRQLVGHIFFATQRNISLVFILVENDRADARIIGDFVSGCFRKECPEMDFCEVCRSPHDQSRVEVYVGISNSVREDPVLQLHTVFRYVVVFLALVDQRASRLWPTPCHGHGQH